jgi:hypothetical protein
MAIKGAKRRQKKHQRMISIYEQVVVRTLVPQKFSGTPIGSLWFNRIPDN